MHEVNAVAAGSTLDSWLPDWARRRTPAPLDLAGSAPLLAASRLILVFTVLAIATMLVSAAIGFSLARQNDDRLSAQQHAMLRGAIAEFRSPSGRSDEIDPRLIRLAEQIFSVKNLKFERDPDAGDREVRPVVGADGRIAGFFTWDKSHPMVRVMGRLASFFAVVVAVFFGFAGLSLWQLKHARRELALRDLQAARAADEDKLTGLPNHSKTFELLDLALAERANGDWATFALIELDGMEDVTAHRGVLGSDEVIVAAAKRLKAVLPSYATCGRIAGDAFAIILTAAPEVNVEMIIRAVLESISHPHWIDDVARVSAHAGFAQAPRHAATRGELTRRTNLSLRAAAKKGPGSIVTFDLSIDAISNDQKFTLLRWTHATRGAIPPATFIPVAEQMGLMDTIGSFVLRRTLEEARRWPNELYVAVNLSPLQVRDSTIVDMVRSALAESGVAPSRLVLEITEGVLIDNPEEMVRRINDLHALGVRVALDDFGSGYSNLGYLQRFPLDKLKIDKSFVAALGRSSNGGVIIQAIAALARALGLSVLVEGVETEHQRVLLRLAGCDEMQGLLFARSAPAKAIDRLLAQARQDGKPLATSGEALTG